MNQSREGADSGEFSLGPLRFHRDGIERGSGEEQQWQIRRESIERVSFEDARPAESPLRQLFWGVAYCAMGCTALWNEHLLLKLVGVGLVALGLFVLRYLVTKVTFLVVTTPQAKGPINLERRLTKEEKTKALKKLKSLGFPA